MVLRTRRDGVIWLRKRCCGYTERVVAINSRLCLRPSLRTVYHHLLSQLDVKNASRGRHDRVDRLKRATVCGTHFTDQPGQATCSLVRSLSCLGRLEPRK